MRRRDFLGKLSLVLMAVPVLKACASEEDYPPRPGGDNGGGGGGGGDDEPRTFRVENTDPSHPHWFEVDCAQLENGQTTWTAQGGHTHQVTISDAQLQAILDGDAVTIETSGGHPHTWRLQMPSALCG